MNQDLDNIWNQVPVTYYQESNFLQKIWHGLKIYSANKLLIKIKFRRCLDIGCASGYMLSKIAQSFPDSEFYGIDVYGKAIDYAKVKYPNIKFKESPADNLPFENSYFDLILCYETIEHVQYPKKVLEEAKRVLSKDGVLILAMDSGNLVFRIIWSIWEKTAGKVWQGAHLHPFHHLGLEELINKEGFKIQNKFFTHLGMEVIFVLKK